jgi:cytochrome P450
VTALVGIERSHELLSAAGETLRQPPLPLERLVPGGLLRWMEPENRARYRPLIASAFSSRVAAARAPELERESRQAVRALDRARPRPVLFGLALRCLVALLIGLAADSRDATRLTSLIGSLPASRLPPVRRRRAERRLHDAVDLLREVSTAGDSSFAGRLLAEDSDVLADETLACNLVYITRTASGDVAGLLHWVLWELARLARPWNDQPEHLVLETLRLHQSEYLYRRAEADFEHDGVKLARGGVLRICVAESHRDPKLFDRPDEFVPERFARDPAPHPFAPFGGPQNSCIAAAIALSIARAFVVALGEVDLRVLADGRPMFDGAHWRPGRRFRVAISEALPKDTHTLE